jgi:hypothetical protein
MQRLYPILYSRPKDLEKYRQLIYQGRYRIRTNKVTDLTGKQQVTIEEEDGADLDLAVLSDSNEEFDAIAQRHFNIWKKTYPEIEMIKVEKVKKYLWEVNGLPRKVQIYPSSLRQIITHHLAMVRGFIFGNGEERMLYCSANCLLSLRHLKSPNYYYFAGIKSPAEVILKYQQRGYAVSLPTHLRYLLTRYSDAEPRWQNKIRQITQQLNDWYHNLKEKPKNFAAYREILNLLFTHSALFSALMGWGNFDIAFLQEEEREFAKMAGFVYNEMTLEKLQRLIMIGEVTPNVPGRPVSPRTRRAIEALEEEEAAERSVVEDESSSEEEEEA